MALLLAAETQQMQQAREQVEDGHEQGKRCQHVVGLAATDDVIDLNQGHPKPHITVVAPVLRNTV